MGEGPHLSTRVRHRAVEAALGGMARKDVAAAFGVDRTTLFRWLQKYEADGERGLDRTPGSGRPRKLEELDEDEVRRLVLKGAIHFGYETDLWSVGRLRRVIIEEYSIELSKNTVWRRLRDAGLTYQKPEREYYEIDEETRKKWKRYEVSKIRRCVQKHRGILYFQDESNVSLTAFLGKTWSPCGQMPKATVTGKRAGVAATSAINGKGRLLFRLVDKRIASAEVIEFLTQLLRHRPRRRGLNRLVLLTWTTIAHCESRTPTLSLSSCFFLRCPTPPRYFAAPRPTLPPTAGPTCWKGYDSVQITAVNGNRVTVEPALKHDHPLVNGIWKAEVLNLMRNVVIEGTPQGRAHVIFLIDRPQTIRNIELRHMGPRQPDERAKFTKGVLGRYALHFHHDGEGSRGSLVENVVIHTAGNHAFVPHGSHDPLTIFRLVDGQRTVLARAAAQDGLEARTDYRLRFRIQTRGRGTDLMVKLWKVIEDEPEEWNLQVLGDHQRRLRGRSGRFGLWTVQGGNQGRKVWYDDYHAEFVRHEPQLE